MNNHILKHYYKFKLFCMIYCFSFMGNIAYADTNVTKEKINFWDRQQKGANIFNQTVTHEDIKVAKKYGIQFIRLAPDKFINSHRDFLIGNADDYCGLIIEDLVKLRQVLNLCLQEEMPVIITMLSLPGSRWKQNNNGNDDLRIWNNLKFQKQAALFWEHLALELRDHPVIVGYNILNEPHPERIYSPSAKHINTIRQKDVQKILYNFYETVIKSIRKVDPHTPIILDSSAYADSKTFEQLIPQNDKNIIYSFHMYEPYEYTNFKINHGKFSYPGNIGAYKWDKDELKKYMTPVINFQQINKVAANRILVGEFGGHRMTPGLNRYFHDLIDIFKEQHWHFAFYAFREDTWDGMDYELGNQKLPWSYWQAIENGEKPYLERKSNYSAFSVIKKAYKESSLSIN